MSKKTIAQIRIETYLAKPTTYPELRTSWETTKKEAMDKAVAEGWLIKAVMIDDDLAKKKDQKILDDANKRYFIHETAGSNPNIPAVKKALAAKKRLEENNYKKPDYRLYVPDGDGAFYEIAKIEHDYAMSISQSEAS